MPEIVLEIVNDAPLVLEMEGDVPLVLELLPGVGPRGAPGGCRRRRSTRSLQRRSMTMGPAPR